MSVMHALQGNLALNTDSYKPSHWKQYPPDTETIFAYAESRGGAYDHTLFFGLQMLLMEYFTKHPMTHEKVDEAAAFYAAHFGRDDVFDIAGWRHIVEAHGGYLPVEIRAVPEGTLVPTRQVLVTAESTDPRVPWAGQYAETALLRAVWYPTTVATRSWHIKQLIQHYLEQTADSTAGLAFKLHDFGARGVSSLESAMLGGAAHLVNFMGSDTVPGIVAVNRYYDEPMAAYSIPAAEHSTVTAWGREAEAEAYRRMLAQYARPGALVAVVTDSYDLWSAIDHLWGGELRQAVIDSGATVVVRPDSGNPSEVVREALWRLDAKFGSTINTKGFKVLNHVRIIQGDGINEQSIEAILAAAAGAGYSADNIAFGMGGELLQRLDRDTLKFAFKASAITRGGKVRAIYKDPVTDPGKASKRGLLTLIGSETGEIRSVDRREPIPPGFRELLEPVYRNGELLRRQALADVRQRANGFRP